MLKKLILFLLIASSGMAQQVVPDADRISFSHQYSYLNTDGYFFIDTSLSSLDWYRQLNNGFQDNFGQLSLGNLGAARNNLLVPTFRDFWTLQSQGPFNDYFTSPEEVPFYHVRSPLTDARYLSGYDRGQVFRIMHTQNINERWNVTLQYKRLNSLGFYEHQQAKQSNLLFSSAYRSKKGIYQAKAYVVNEKLDLQENGGILNDSLFTDNLQTTRVLFNTNLATDRRVQHNLDVWLDHKLDFYRVFKRPREQVIDTLTTDSLSLDSVPEVAESMPEEARPKILLGHQFRYQRVAQTYFGSISNFYTNFFYDQSNAWQDSSSFRTLTNKLYLETEVGDSSKFQVRAAAVHQYFNYLNHQRFEINDQQLGLEGKIKGNYKDYFETRAEASYVLSGPFANNFDLNAYAEGKLYRSFRGFAQYRIQNKAPDLYTQVYFGNNFRWNQDFSPILSNELRFGIRWQKENFLRFRTYTANNFVYFDAQVNPQAANDVVAYQSVDLVQNFDFWSWLHLDNSVSYQIALSGSEFLPLPELVNRHSLYFEFQLFGGALKVLTGVEGSYFSQFNTPSYMPSVGRFYLANEYPIGDYWMVDAFAQFKISKAIFFMKMENLTQGLVPYNYWAAPHFPLNDRVFRFGINWRFFN